MGLAIPRELPMLAGPRARAMALAWNPDADLRQFTAVAEGDPSLTAALLRAANAASSAPRKRVQTAHEAVVRIGLDAVRQRTAAALLYTQFTRLEETRLDVNQLWRHLLAVGLLAEEFAENADDRQISFTAGLLHDLGRVALATQHSARYTEVIDAVRRGADIEEAERASFSTTHAAWGGEIAKAWGLPDAIVNVVGDHHTRNGHSLTRAIFDAREAAWSLGIGDGIVEPHEVTYDEESPYREVVESLGGAEGVQARIRWFRNALQPR